MGRALHRRPKCDSRLAGALRLVLPPIGRVDQKTSPGRLVKMCSRTGCEAAGRRRGMCDTHYSRWRRATPVADRRQPTAEERFWSKVDKRGLYDCWPWTDAPTDRGYGTIQVEGRRVRAHRFAYLLAHGTCPEVLDHTCHNGSGCPGGASCRHRLCCNPAHLEGATALLNTLRGESVTAQRARQTHCVNGHEFSKTNTHVAVRNGRPVRVCKKCRFIRKQAYVSRRAKSVEE